MIILPIYGIKTDLLLTICNKIANLSVTVNTLSPGFIYHYSRTIYIYKILIPLYNFSSETTEPVFTKFHVEPSVVGLLRACSRLPCPYGVKKNLKVFFRTIKALRLKTGTYEGCEVQEVFFCFFFQIMVPG